MIRSSLNREAARQAFTLLIAIAAAWLAISFQPWAITLVVGALGLLYALVPPALNLPRLLVILIGLFLAINLLSFGPAELLPNSYRTTLLAQGLNVGWMLTPQPWNTLEDLTLCWAGILWALNCFSAIRMNANRTMLLSSFIVAMVPVAISVIVNGTNTNSTVPELSIGQFVDRTFTGDVLLMAGLGAFACGIVKLQIKRGYGPAWFVVSLLFMFALARDGSRAPLALFGVGILAYLFMQKSYRANFKWITASLVLAFMLGAVALSVGGRTLTSRFYDLAMGHDLRGATFLDTLALTVKNPVYGIGLGNFDAIFNTTRTYSIHTPFRMLFPESDWLWLGVETGFGGLFVMIAILVCVWTNYYQGNGTSFPTSLSCVLALVFLLHSCVDAPAHSIGTAWNFLFLIGLGVNRSFRTGDISPPVWLLRIFGLSLIVLAGFRLQSDSMSPWMPTGASRDTVQTAIRQANFEDQIRILNQSLKWDPLNYLLYYQRGIVQMERASTIGNTMSDFRKALFLEQTAPQIPDLIQQACRQCALPQADEIRKEVTRFTIARDSNLFRNYYDPKIDSLNDKGRSTLAQGNPEMEALAVLLQQPGDFDVWLSALLADNEPLKGVMPGTQKELFDRWAAQGDCAKLVNEWPDHPNWRLFGAKAHLMALARLNRIPEAVSSALEILKPKKLPDIAPGTDLEQTEREFQFNHDVYDGIQAYLALEKAGEKDHAKSVLQQVAVMPGCPDYVHYLLGQGFHNEGNNEEAWKSLYPLVVNL